MPGSDFDIGVRYLSSMIWTKKSRSGRNAVPAQSYLLLGEGAVKGTSPCILAFVQLLIFVLSVPVLVNGAARPQERQPLGSLSASGDVSVNGSTAPAESTIFTGDKLLTGNTGTAIFTIAGKGSFKLSARTQLVFAASPQYLAELQSGTVVMESLAGSTDVTLRAGNFVVGPVIQTEKSVSRIEKAGDGSFAIYCLDGSVGLIPLQGATGRVLEANQSVAISPQGDLVLIPEAPAPVPPTAPSSNPPQSVPTAQKSSHKGWIIVGAAGGAGVIGAAVAAGHGGGRTAVSPSVP